MPQHLTTNYDQLGFFLAMWNSLLQTNQRMLNMTIIRRCVFQSTAWSEYMDGHRSTRWNIQLPPVKCESLEEVRVSWLERTDGWESNRTANHINGEVHRNINYTNHADTQPLLTNQPGRLGIGWPGAMVLFLFRNAVVYRLLADSVRNDGTSSFALWRPCLSGEDRVLIMMLWFAK